jgi:hypothetical protein
MGRSKYEVAEGWREVQKWSFLDMKGEGED